MHAVAETLRTRLPTRARNLRPPSRRRVESWQSLRRYLAHAEHIEACVPFAQGLTSVRAQAHAGSLRPATVAVAGSRTLCELVGWMALEADGQGYAGRLCDWADLLRCSTRQVQRCLAVAVELELVVVHQRYVPDPEGTEEGRELRYLQCSSLYAPGPALRALIAENSKCPSAGSGSGSPLQESPEILRVDIDMPASPGMPASPAARGANRQPAEAAAPLPRATSLPVLRRALAADVSRMAPEGVSERDRRAEGAGELMSAAEARENVRAIGAAVLGMRWAGRGGGPPASPPEEVADVD